MKYLLFAGMVVIIGLLLSGFEIKIITEQKQAVAAPASAPMAEKLVKFYDFGTAAGLYRFYDDQYVCYMLLGSNTDDLDCKPKYPQQ